MISRVWDPFGCCLLVGGATHACVGGRGASRPVSAHSTQHTVHSTHGPWKLEVGSWKSPEPSKRRKNRATYIYIYPPTARTALRHQPSNTPGGICWFKQWSLSSGRSVAVPLLFSAGPRPLLFLLVSSPFLFSASLIQAPHGLRRLFYVYSFHPPALHCSQSGDITVIISIVMVDASP